ncbi:dihydrolipoamide acetyltransferase family protein [Thalassorhabdus alkalitolerans]|uniref:Dihydrolipoamide acetyltransferase component of pyruvate dehydrogenase complex n=1 Tax=Thalassorhabdus alkalitolerans TaxID=2282697 RepID=A0ABW0YPC4_9BACI
MAEKITMPQLGESVTEGTISKWLVKPGDKVNKYDPIAEVMTDKVNAEVPSSFTGTITELVAGEDETIQVGDLICYMEVEGKGSTDQRSKENVQPPKEEEKQSTDSSAQSMKTRYSPAVLRLAQENDIDLSTVQGSGRGGRITRKDVLSLVNKGAKPAREEKHDTYEEPKKRAPSIEQKQQIEEKQKSESGDQEIPVSGVRKAIAVNMVRSKHEIPHAWTMVEVDVTNIAKFREANKKKFKEKEGISLTFFPFFMKAVVEALKEYPELNSTWAGDKIIRKKDINLSIAVATEDALFVPVVKHADEKSIKGLARSVQDLAGKVRNGTLKGEEMQGGTFTINNTGSFGSVQSMPIINHPQAAILSVESIVKKPVVMEGDMIAIRHMVNLCLSLDHRVLDGLVCGRFLSSIKTRLESFDPESESLY